MDRKTAHPLIRYLVKTLAEANGADAEWLWDVMERKRRIPHETVEDIAILTHNEVTAADFDVEMPPRFVASTVTRPGQPIAHFRRGVSGSRHPTFTAWVEGKYGSVQELAKVLGIKRSTLAAYATGRNSCPMDVRRRIHDLSGGAVSLQSWDEAQRAFRIEQSDAA